MNPKKARQLRRLAHRIAGPGVPWASYQAPRNSRDTTVRLERRCVRAIYRSLKRAARQRAAGVIA